MNATKTRFGAVDLDALLADASKIIVAKGKKVLTFDLRKDSPGSEALAAAVLGPTGNLRAPTVRIGRTWLVGLSEEALAGLVG